MISVLAIDPATTAGWAFWKTGAAKPRAGTWKLGALEQHAGTTMMGKWLDQYCNTVDDFCAINEVTDIVVESPFIPVYNGGVNMDSAAVNVTLVKINHLLAYRRAARVHEMMRPHVLYHAIRKKGGERKMLKQECMLRCQQKGWNVTDDNVADALMTLDYWLYKEDVPGVPWDCSPILAPLFEGRGVKVSDLPKASQAKVNGMVNAAMRKMGE